MSQSTGRYLALSLPRRFMGDWLHLAQQVPTVVLQRSMRLTAVLSARGEAQPRPGWCALFTKAYALVCSHRPELRRVYLSFPWPRLYEHAENIASVAIERRLDEEDAVFFAQLCRPEQQSLSTIDAYLRSCKEEPLERLAPFRRALRFSRLPRPLRRFLWWSRCDVSGPGRALRLGTFGVNVVSMLGAASLHIPSPLTTTLSYGVIARDGSVDVRLSYDHRVLDGCTVARALEELEDVLHGEIVTELRYLRKVEAA